MFRADGFVVNVHVRQLFLLSSVSSPQWTLKDGATYPTPPAEMLLADMVG